MSDPSPSPPEILQTALAWLAAPPAPDSWQDLAPMKRLLEQLADLRLPPAEQLRALGPFRDRLREIGNALKPELAQAALPLPHRLRAIARGLLDCHGLMAGMFLGTGDIGASPAAEPDSCRVEACTRALDSLAEQQQIAVYVSMADPEQLWLRVQKIFWTLATIGDKGGMTAEADAILKGMLALAAVQPGSFSAAELDLLIAYLRNHAATVEVRRHPAPPLDTWHWLEQSRDSPPVAISRKSPPNHGTLVYFSCIALARTVGQHIQQIADGGSLVALGVAESAGVVDAAEVLARAQARWASTAWRQSHRRPNHYRVEVCTPLDRLWTVLRGDSGNDTEPLSSEWMVLNESAGGLGLMHVAGPIAVLNPGDVVGVRQSPGQPWNVYVIRWTRSENPEHYELGVEMIAVSAVPVEVARPGNRTRGVLPALLCPPVPGLERKEALLTTGSYPADRPITLVTESEGRLRVGECRAARLVLQTAKVTMFEFDRSASPF